MNKMKMLLFGFASLSLLSLAFIGSTKDINPTKQKQGVRKIVIDPGHGGSDPGAHGKHSNEADIALAVALKLEAEIKKQMPDVEVYMTRTTDVFDHVRVKAEKANAAKGDLFISIHCNDAAPSRHSELIGHKTVKYKKGKKWKTKEVPQYRTYNTPSSAKGTETYIWGVEKNDDKERALRENESIYTDSATKNDLTDDKDQIIAISLRMQQYAERSRNLAFTVQDEFVKVGRVSRDARQRAVGIWVLQAVAMPAILVELGFISNPEEEAYLNSEEGQKELSESISRAVKRYKTTIEAKINGNSGNK
jgi:N-acetylmuramoyl-L-alanine amidase